MSDFDFSRALEEPFLGLTPEIVREVFPIAPSMRRRYATHFETYIDTADFRNDDLFYLGLCEALRDPDWVEEIEAAFINSGRKDGARSFSIRAVRWLAARSELDCEPENIPALPEATFLSGSPERAIHRVVRDHFLRVVGDAAANRAAGQVRSGAEVDAFDDPEEVAELGLATLLMDENVRDRAWLSEVRAAFESLVEAVERSIQAREAAEGAELEREQLARRVGEVIGEAGAAGERLAGVLDQIAGLVPAAVPEMIALLDAVAEAAGKAKIARAGVEETRRAYRTVLQRAIDDPRALGEAGPLGERLMAGEAAAVVGEADLTASIEAVVALAGGDRPGAEDPGGDGEASPEVDPESAHQAVAADERAPA